jgi:uncharacterized protein
MTLATLLRRLLLAGVFALGLGGAQPAFAQPTNSNPSPAAVALAKELLAQKGLQQLLEGLIGNLIDRTKDQFIPTNPSLNRPLTEVATQLKAEFEPKKAELINEVSRAYARHFTEAELRELVAFYKTNLGRKVLTTEPQAAESSLKRATELQGQYSEQILNRLRTEMKKKGHDI